MTDPPRDRARATRRVAMGLLVAMAALFALSTRLAAVSPGWEWPRAFAEAAMVGGLADWFAVTALFRRPLGLPIPHTAIIPANKDRIAETMASFLKTWFLTPQVVARRLHGLNLAKSAGAHLVAPASRGQGRLREGAASLAVDVLQSLDAERLGGLLKAGMRRQLERVELAPMLGQLLSAAIADRRHLPVLEAMLRKAGELLEANETLLRAMVHTRASTILRVTGLDERIANALLDGTYRLLAECIVEPDHPLRRKVEQALAQLARDLQDDAGLRLRVEAFKHEILANPAAAAWLDGLWERVRAALLRAAGNPDRALGGSLGEGLATLGKALVDDRRLQALVNRFARRTLVGIVSRYGAAIVTLVSETVRRWDARTVTDRIESAVGRDLQFIRINGTLVGGLVGLAIHGVAALLAV